MSEDRLADWRGLSATVSSRHCSVTSCSSRIGSWTRRSHTHTNLCVMCRHSEELAFFALHWDWLRWSSRCPSQTRDWISLFLTHQQCHLFPFPSFLFITISTTTLRLFTSTAHCWHYCCLSSAVGSSHTVIWHNSRRHRQKLLMRFIVCLCECVWNQFFLKLRRLKLGDSFGSSSLCLLCTPPPLSCHNCRSNEFELYYRFTAAEFD